MAGFFTPGLPAASNAQLWTGSAAIPLDTNLANGTYPQSVYATPQQLAAAGEAQALTYGTTMSVDASLGTFASFTFGAGNTTMTISNLPAGGRMRFKVTQDGTGSRTMTVAAGSGGSTLTSGTPLTTTASATDLVEVMNVGTTAAPVYYYYPIAKAFS